LDRFCDVLGGAVDETPHGVEVSEQSAVAFHEASVDHHGVHYAGMCL
jgi:hypothetical protein